jgi:hypothetical protein
VLIVERGGVNSNFFKEDLKLLHRNMEPYFILSDEEKLAKK